MLGTIDTISHAISEGMAYDVSAMTSLANNQSLILIGKTGSSDVHFKDYNIFSNQGGYSFGLYEAPTVTSLGTLATAVNRNRKSMRQSEMQIYNGGTVSSNGTLLHSFMIYEIGNGSHIQGANGSVLGEWILRPNTDYMIKITNTSGETIEMSPSFFFYEV